MAVEKQDVGFGIVGNGMISRVHLTAMEALRALLPAGTGGVPSALCTRHPEKAAGMPYRAVYTSMEDMLADEAVQLVDICTPNNLHYEQAMAALVAGRAVYLEKPLAHTLEGARALWEKAEGMNAVNQTALMMRFAPATNRAKDLLASGAIGLLIHFRANIYHYSYMDPNRPTSWRQQLASSGGGVVMDLGVHMLDLVRYIIGEVGSVTAKARTVYPQRYTDTSRTATVPNDTDEYLCAMLEMEGGAYGLMETSRVSRSTETNYGIELFGTEGTLRLSLDGTGHVQLWQRGGAGITMTDGTEPGPCEAELAGMFPFGRQALGPFVGEHAAAIQNICNLYAGRPGFSGTPDFREGYRAQQLVQACLDSAEKGQTVYMK